MDINLLSNNRGVIIDRQPIQIADKEKLAIKFVNSEIGSKITITDPKGEARTQAIADDGKCTLQKPFLQNGGVFDLQVTCGDKVWICEKIYTADLGFGRLFVAPYENGLPQKIVDIELDGDLARKDIEKILKDLGSVSKKINEIIKAANTQKQVIERLVSEVEI